MFCTSCGADMPAAARFCSSCGTALSTLTSPPPAHGRHQTSSPGMPPRTAGNASHSALFDQHGQPLPAFNRLAATLFHAIDQTVKPQQTGGLEVSKMTAWRTMGGQSVPPLYGEHVLPTYARTVGIELVPGQPATAPVVTWNGWHQFLSQKIRLEPDSAFRYVTRALSALKITLPLQRSDFPASPSPQAQATETQFKTAIYALAQNHLAGGATGGGGGGANAAALARMRLQMAQSLANTMNQAGSSMLSSSTPPGQGYWTTNYY